MAMGPIRNNEWLSDWSIVTASLVWWIEAGLNQLIHWLTWTCRNWLRWIGAWVQYYGTAIRGFVNWSQWLGHRIWNLGTKPALDIILSALGKLGNFVGQWPGTAVDVMNKALNWVDSPLIYVGAALRDVISATVGRLVAGVPFVQQAATAITDAIQRIEAKALNAVSVLTAKSNEHTAWLVYALESAGTLREEITGATAMACQGAIVHGLIEAGRSEDPALVAKNVALRFPTKSTAQIVVGFANGQLGAQPAIQEALARFRAS